MTESSSNNTLSWGERAKSWVSEQWASLKESGNHNWLFALPGALLGFIYAQSAASGAFGGGIFSQIAALPLAAAAAMAGAVISTKVVHSAHAWMMDEVPNAQSQEAHVEKTQETKPTKVTTTEAPEITLGELSAPPLVVAQSLTIPQGVTIV